MIKLCTRLRSFVVSDTDDNDEIASNTKPRQQPDVEIGQRGESILNSRRQQSADSGFDVGCWR